LEEFVGLKFSAEIVENLNNFRDAKFRFSMSRISLLVSKLKF